MPVALFSTGMPSASTATLPSDRRIETAGAAADEEFEGLRVALELLEEVVGQVDPDGGRPSAPRISLRRRLGGRELLVHVARSGPCRGRRRGR